MPSWLDAICRRRTQPAPRHRGTTAGRPAAMPFSALLAPDLALLRWRRTTRRSSPVLGKCSGAWIHLRWGGVGGVALAAACGVVRDAQERGGCICAPDLPATRAEFGGSRRTRRGGSRQKRPGFCRGPGVAWQALGCSHASRPALPCRGMRHFNTSRVLGLYAPRSSMAFSPSVMLVSGCRCPVHWQTHR